MQWQKVALVGVGLLGGSLGLALKKRGLARHVHGFVRRAASMAECLDKRAVDSAGTDLAAAVESADLIILCTPLSQMLPLTEAMLPSVQHGALITDVGSVKGQVVADLEPRALEGGANFIGSHPMAGSEKVGVAHARDNLFEKAVCVLTPTALSPQAETEKLAELWKAVGGTPITMTPGSHDELVGRTSHLPHVMAAELAHYVLDPSGPSAQAELCATGFRDTTRIASGSPQMWCDICLANRDNLVRELAGFTARLGRFRTALENGDLAEMLQFFEEAKQRRDAWCDHKASPSHE